MKFFSTIWNKRLLDEFKYYIPQKVIKDTESILIDFPSNYTPHEMIVYWVGIKEKNKSIVNLVVVPNAKTSFNGLIVSQEDNFHFVKVLSSRSLFQIAQVHTHPSSWVGHSLGDSKYAAFKVKGLLSIVVPSFCKKGMLPLERCGIYLFDGEKFVRLMNRYVKNHFYIINSKDSELEDLRK